MSGSRDHNGAVRFLNNMQPSHELTYNDVFMVPSRSAVSPLAGTHEHDGMTTPLPLVVANMTAIPAAECRDRPRRGA